MPRQQSLETNWLQNSFLQRAPMGLCEAVEHNSFIYDTIFLLHLDLFTMLEQGNAENKQQKNLYQESNCTPSGFPEQAVPGKQGQEQIDLVSKLRTSISQ